MVKNYKNYNSALWEEGIEDIAKKANKYPLREIDSIGITQSELDKIAELHNTKYGKIIIHKCYVMRSYIILFQKIIMVGLIQIFKNYIE